MGLSSFSFSNQTTVAGVLSLLRGKPRLQQALKWVLFCLGLTTFVAVQTGFIAGPVWKRAMLPEVDDSYAYLVKTAEMEQCFLQNCPALEDLRQQVPKRPANDEVALQKFLVEGRIFLVYHPLFSAILVGLNWFIPDLATAYRVLWTVGPAFFGLAFACWLLVLWGPVPAGIALILLSTKLFPSNGIHYVVPSCMALGIGMLTWSRVISRNGDAPWSLMTGTLLMVLMHPMGRVFATVGIAISWLLSGCSKSWRSLLPSVVSASMVAGAFVVPRIVSRPQLDVVIDGGWKWSAEFAHSITTVMVEIVRFETSLFGSLCLFVGAAVYGYLVSSAATKAVVRIVVLVFIGFLAVSLLYVVPDHPADVFLRLWIPLVVLLFGAVGNAIRHSAKQAVRYLESRGAGEFVSAEPSSGWQVVVFAVLVTFSFQMVVFGVEGFSATTEYMKNRQPLYLDPAQPKILTDRAAPGDRVFYDNAIVIMPFYFVHGAMKLGAVYYPILQGSPEREKWMERPDLRFAAVYNPIVSLPGFQDKREEEWWVSSPELRFSPLSRPRKPYGVSREGKILASSVQYMEITPQENIGEGSLRIFVENHRKSPERIQITPVDNLGHSLASESKTLEIPSRLSGWVDTRMTVTGDAKSLRIDILPKSRLHIGGLKFGEDRLNWPWAQRGRLTLVPRAADTGPVVVGFIPEALLPEPFNTRKITVLDDRGCTVLFEITSQN